MSIDLQEPLDGIESARMAIDEFRGAEDQYTTFFGDVFDDLQNLSLELYARHKCLELSAEQKSESEEALAGVREALQQSVEQLQQLHGHLQAGQEETRQNWTEIRAGYQRYLDDQENLRESVRQIGGEFLGVKEDMQRQWQELRELCAHAEAQLARLSAVTAELAEAQARPLHDPQMAEVLEHLKQQQADWQQQRTGLETELEAARRRTAEQTEALHEQKRLADQQQAELAGELKRLRSLMEALAGQVRGEPLIPGQNPKPSRVDSAVLGSVLAEFEMLQRDMPFRRAKRNHDASPGDPMFPGS